MELKKTAKIIEALLKISRRPVGVKLVHSREEFMKYDAGITLSRPAIILRGRKKALRLVTLSK